jgi:hypothetical protein
MKKFFAFVLAMIMVACMFVGCVEAKTAYDSEKDAVVETAIADLVQIPGYDYLYYSTTERTVYYLFEYYAKTDYASGFFGPYIRNGHYCEYSDGKIVEVIPTVKIEDVTN